MTCSVVGKVGVSWCKQRCLLQCSHGGFLTRTAPGCSVQGERVGGSHMASIPFKNSWLYLQHHPTSMITYVLSIYCPLFITIHYCPKTYPPVSIFVICYPFIFRFLSIRYIQVSEPHVFLKYVLNPSAEITKTKQFVSRQGCRASAACPDMWFTCLLPISGRFNGSNMEK